MTWCQLNLQNRNAPLIEEFVFFHDFIIIILSRITFFVGIIILISWQLQNFDLTTFERQRLEIIWTIIPGIILIQIALPSLSLLYLFEERYNCNLTIKALGHQWYWSYEYWDFSGNKEGFSFDSYILPLRNNKDQFRLLDVDSRLILPFLTNIRVLVSSTDVLHSWTVPSLGVKADAIPGRVNQLKFLGLRRGLFYGQCSEICGANHRFIPIVLELIRLKDFIKWCEAQYF